MKNFGIIDMQHTKWCTHIAHSIKARAANSYATRPIGNDVYASMKTQHEDDNNKAASQLFDQKVNPWRRNRLRRYGQRRNAHINLVCCSRAFGQPHTYRGTTLRFTK